jgi:protein farnesyltransferase/geranylgeranyltransferase type-1 subunit alpha
MSSVFAYAGLERTPQDDGPDPVAPIAYSEDFRLLMDYFRSVVKLQEYSERALSLTEDILEHNAANYTVWQYRRDCLKALGSDLHRELSYVDDFASENPKNYQIWNHRRAIVKELGDGSRELQFCGDVFGVDAKNYHAWAHRQWTVQNFDLWAGEFDFIGSMLDLDIRNNSAWNHRWFVLHQQPGQLPEGVIRGEIGFAFTSLNKVKNNESAWNYLKGLANKYPEVRALIRGRCDEMVSTSEGGNPFAVALLAELWELEGSCQGLETAVGLFTLLIDIDKIREKSWRKRINSLTGT